MSLIHHTALYLPCRFYEAVGTHPVGPVSMLQKVLRRDRNSFSCQDDGIRNNEKRVVPPQNRRPNRNKRMDVPPPLPPTHVKPTADTGSPDHRPQERLRQSRRSFRGIFGAPRGRADRRGLWGRGGGGIHDLGQGGGGRGGGSDGQGACGVLEERTRVRGGEG